MSTYAPGTVATATVRGVESVRVFRRRDHHGTDRWETATNLNGWLGHDDSDVADVRPLVVLDLDEVFQFEDPNKGARLARFLREVSEWRGDRRSGGNAHLRILADQIEAQTKPPRIDEPGLWGVVEAGFPEGRGRCDYVRRAEDGYWYTLRGAQRQWAELIDPTLIREGVNQ